MTIAGSELRGQIIAVLRDWAAGRIPPGIATMRLILLAPGGAEPAPFLDHALADAGLEPDEAAELRRLAGLAATDRQAWRRVRDTAASIPHDLPPASDVEDGVTRLAARFDAAARVSPEASVALYSLGDPARLDAATAEIADWLRAKGLVGTDRSALDIGCGIGRMERALGPALGRIVGCDISEEMIRIAHARCADLANVAFRRTDGTDLAGFEDESFDLVLAVDVFPYLVATGGGLAEAHVREGARVLKPGGQLAIFNLSYRGAPEQDRADLARWAAEAGLTAVERDVAPFRRWDATVFRMVKPGTDPGAGGAAPGPAQPS